ncbi:hypothetical protein [Paenibacillus harenae]|nr:hypothetical protein [Paenibacillus harenae]
MRKEDKGGISGIAAVRRERPAPCGAREALEDLKLAEAYIRSFYSQHA